VVPFLESAVNHYSSQLTKISESKNAEIAELKKQIEGLVGASPNLGTATTDAQEADDDVDDKSLTNFGATLLRR
jgi:cell division septum initiation protein DivIVA